MSSATSISTESPRIARMRAQFTQALQPQSLDITDDSHLHSGHVGARDGKGHFSVRIVAQCFVGLRPMARHQMVYRAVNDLMQSDIHALSIVALAPDEAA